MNTKEILANLWAERDKLDKAIAALEALAETPPASKANDKATKGAAGKPKKRVMSAAGRKRIAEAQRARWAAKKASEKNAAEVKKSLQAGTSQGGSVRVRNARKRGKA